MSTGWKATWSSKESANPSERAYQRLLPRGRASAASHQRKWLYYKLFPNVAFDIYPDQVDFMQFLPVSATETVIREISYALPDERREMKIARLSQLAHQPPGQRRGHRADHPRPARHAVAEPMWRAAGNERSVPAQLRAEAQEADPGGAAGFAAAARLEPFSQREMSSGLAGRASSAMPPRERLRPAPMNIAIE